MKAIGYVRVSTPTQAERGVSLEAEAEKIRAMCVVHGADLLELIVDGGESAKSLQRPRIERLLALVDAKKVDAVIVAKLDRLTRSVRDLCALLGRFERRGVALISVAHSPDPRPATGQGPRRPRSSRVRPSAPVSCAHQTDGPQRQLQSSPTHRPRGSWRRREPPEPVARNGGLRRAEGSGTLPVPSDCVAPDRT